MPSSPLPTAPQARSTGLGIDQETVIISLTVIAGLLLSLWLTYPSEIPGPVRTTAYLVMLLGLAPIIIYYAEPVRSREKFPFMPYIGLAYIYYYAFRIVGGGGGVSYMVYIDRKLGYGPAVNTAFVGLVTLLAGYYVLRHRLRRKRIGFVDHTRFDLSRLVRASISMGVVGAVAKTALNTGVVPTTFASIFVFIDRLGFVGMNILLMAGLTRKHRGVLVLGLVLFAYQFAMALVSGLVAQVGFLTAQVVFALVASGVRFRVGSMLVLAAFGLTILVAKSVINDYREIAWYQNDSASVVEKLSLIGTLTVDKVATQGFSGALTEGSDAIGVRSSNTDLLADVIARTPSEVPYWQGGSYLSLVGSFVPRVLWPSKPVKNLGQTFGVRYKYLDPTDTRTSVNFPVLVEFYANFGLWGVVLGMALVGAIYAIVERFANRPGQGLVLSAFGIVLMTGLLNIESDFSLIMGGLILDGLAFTLVFRMLRRYAARPSMAAATYRPRQIEGARR